MRVFQPIGTKKSLDSLEEWMILNSSEYQSYEPNMKLKEVRMGNSCKCFELLTLILMEKIKRTVEQFQDLENESK